MIKKLRALFEKYREIIVYVIVGGMSTVVSWGCKFLWGAVFYPGVSLPSFAQTTVLNIVENVSGILFAYFPNRKWVFRSTDPHILKEFAGFAGSRLGTWGMSYVLNLLFVQVLHIDYRITTVIVGVFVVIGNYIISKFLVFRKKAE